MTVVDRLRQVFPRLRFVITTHEPLSLRGAERGEVHVLRHDDETSEVVVTQRDIPPGLTADGLLTGSWFGMATTLDDGTIGLLQEHSQLLLQKRTSEVSRRREEIEEVLRRRQCGLRRERRRAPRALGGGGAARGPAEPHRRREGRGPQGRAREGPGQAEQEVDSMMRYPRPRKPSNFEETVRAKRNELLANPNSPTLQFTALWSAFKPVFSEAQGGKCGYCELAVTGGQDGDVEHYAPKSEVAVLGADRTTWGEELPSSSRVRGRRPLQLSPAGYWWLAYDWGNYLLACAVCNQKWKGTVFPITEPPPRTLPPAEVVSESALLLHPFGRADPAVHLHFNEDGSVEPWRSSRRGLETIKTVGLDRPEPARLPTLSGLGRLPGDS